MAVRRVDLTVDVGDRVCLLGLNGSGKTTLLRCLSLLTEPSSGELRFAGDLVGRWPARRSDGPKLNISEFRQRVGIVFQHFELFPHLTAVDNVAFGPRRALGLSKADARKRAMALLDRMQLAEFATSKPRALSGGQKQRVAIARTLAMEPELVLFDEPTSALDTTMVHEVLDLMTVLANDGLSMIIVTHELNFARGVGTRVVVMDDGAVIEKGPAKDVFASPQHERTRAILTASGRQH